MRIYVNKIENTIKFKIKRGYNLELLTPETMKLLGSTKSKINKDENGKIVHRLEITVEVLVHCNIAKTDHQQDSRVLNTFVPNKLFGQLLEISQKNVIYLKTFNSEFPCIELLFTDQNSKPLETEDKISITLVIN